MSSEIISAIKQICNEKNIPLESVIETIEAAMAVAYRKDFGIKNQNVKVDFDMETGTSRVYDEKTVVEKGPEPEVENATEEGKAVETKEVVAEGEVKEEEKLKKAKKGKKKASKEEEEKEVKSEEKKPEETKLGDALVPEEEPEKKFNPKTDIVLEDAKTLKSDAQIGDVIRTELIVPAEYGRMAAQTAKQVIIQKLREAERETLYNDFQDKIGEIVHGIVQRVEGRVVLVDLGQAVAVMPPQEQISTERYSPGQKVKVFIVSVEKTNKGPEVIVSRSNEEMVRKLFSVEVPEINSGAIEIKSIAREAGSRTKIAVMTAQENIDPIGSCVGQRGSRVQTIINELGGEKIDIVEWSDDPVRFIINALSPAKVLSVTLKEEQKTAFAEVKDDQLSLAIGKTGQNVRLSSRLTGWKIDIVKESGEPVQTPDDKKAAEKLKKEKKNEITLSDLAKKSAEENKDKE